MCEALHYMNANWATWPTRCNSAYVWYDQGENPFQALLYIKLGLVTILKAFQCFTAPYSWVLQQYIYIFQKYYEILSLLVTLSPKLNNFSKKFRKIPRLSYMFSVWYLARLFIKNQCKQLILHERKLGKTPI